MPASTKVTTSFDRYENPRIALPLKMVTPFRRGIMTAWMILADLISLIFAGWLSISIRSWLGGSFTNLGAYYALVPLLTIFFIAYSISGLYPGIGMTPIEELRRTTRSSSSVVVALSLIAFLTQTGMKYSRLAFVLFWILTLIIVPVNRLIARRLGYSLGIWGEPFALIGFGPQGQRILRFLQQNRLYGIKPVVIMNGQDHSEMDPDKEIGLPEINASILVNDKMFLARSGIRSAILVPTEIPASLRDALVDEQQFGLKKLILISSLNWIGGTAVVAHDMGGLLGLEVERNLLDAPQRLFKRFVDLCITALGGLVGFPILLLCAVLIHLDSSGPIFYRQERIGKDGKKFRLWKFRTMVPNADEILEKYLSKNPELREEWETSHKLKKDPRVTRVGKILRKFSLDELPQLINILAGEMSLVGPRPIVADEVKFYEESFRLYTQVLPGLTGLWQVSGRSDTSYRYRVSLDEYYIRHWSIWMDIYILIRTVWVVIKRSGAY